MKQLKMEIPETKKKCIPCPIQKCKKIAWEDFGIDNQKYYFCPKHGVVRKVEDEKSQNFTEGNY